MKENIIYSALLMCITLANLSFAVYAWRIKNSAGTVTYAMLMLVTALYTFGYSLELASPSLPQMLFWNNFQYLGIPFMPALFAILAIQYTGNERFLSRSVLIFLFPISLLFLIIIWSNPLHQLFYGAPMIDASAPFPTLTFEHGILYYAFQIYINACFLLGNLLFFWMSIITKGIYRKQAFIMVIATLLPWLGYLIYLLGLSPHGLDTTAFAITLSGFFFAWGLLRYRLFALLPIVRDRVFESMREGVVVLDNNNTLIDFNSSAAGIISELNKPSIGKPARDIFFNHPDLLGQLSANTETITLSIVNGQQKLYYISNLSLVLNNYKEELGKLLIFNDYTEQNNLLQKLERLSTIDDLTNLLNRRHFIQLSQNQIELAKRTEQPYSLIYFDLDCFKNINDTYGHATGDQALIAIANACSAELRPYDILGRLGGEEFAVFLPETSFQAALTIAERLRKKIASTEIKIGEFALSITASFGVTAVTKELLSIDQLLQQADSLLYEAKKDGGNKIR